MTTTLIKCRNTRAAEILVSALRLEAPSDLTSQNDCEVMTTATAGLVWAVIFRRLK